MIPASKPAARGSVHSRRRWARASSNWPGIYWNSLARITIIESILRPYWRKGYLGSAVGSYAANFPEVGATLCPPWESRQGQNASNRGAYMKPATATMPKAATYCSSISDKSR